MVCRAAGQLADGMAQAVATLRKLLTAESESIRLAAARSILEIGPRLRETAELEERLAAVESRMAAAPVG
jgi:hypothetical protein